MRRSRAWAVALLALLTVTITWGGLMAGFHAGFVAPTFPTMNGAWVPAGMWRDSPALVNLVDSPLTIHFAHRLLAYLTVLGALVLGWAVWRTDDVPQTCKRLALGLGALALSQAALGVLTVLTFVQLEWASLHQLNAVLLLGVLVALTHQLTPRRAPSRAAEPGGLALAS